MEQQKVSTQVTKVEAVDVPNLFDKLSKSKRLQLHETMIKIRKMEERTTELYGLGKIAGFLHLYIGQEAVVMGLQAHSLPGDYHITTYRDHGHMVACGMEVEGVIAELMGREAGYSKGKGGSMHMFSPEKGFFGGHGIVGASVPLGTGLAFAQMYREQKHEGKANLTLNYYGDGASHQGQVYESYNMAMMWKLPVIFVIENNGYAMGTSVARSTSQVELFRRAQGFDMPSARVNGMNLQEVYNHTAAAFEHVRSGKGPYLLEMMTYRYRGHSMSDPAKYRSKEEVESFRVKDPIESMKAYLIKNKLALEGELNAMEAKITADVIRAVEMADKSPEPDPKTLYTDVYL